MKQVLVQLDEATASQLEAVAPGRSRKRSEFIRRAIARALQEALETTTRAAYERWPDEPPAVDASEWAPKDEAMHAPPRRKSARRRRTAR